MDEAAVNGSLCTYQRLDNGIHEYVMNQLSRATVDVWFAQIDEVLASVNSTETTRHLIDSRIGMLPLAYSFRAGQAFYRRHPNRPPSRIVILYSGNFIMSLVLTFINLLPTDQRDVIRFFAVDKRDAAITWLLAAEG
jgi:hypothetical protein